MSSLGALTVSGVGVSIGAARILSAVRLELSPGQLVALIGPSGSGKSTLMKVMLGIREPTRGSVSLGGKPVRACGPLGYVPQGDALHRTLSVEDELGFAAALRLPGVGEQERSARVDEVLRQVGLQERRKLKIARLSGGQRKRVSVALELLTSQGLLILDEPTSGLDPGLEERMMRLFAELARGGHAERGGRVVLVATHAMQSLALCQLVVVLVAGCIAYAGPPARAPQYFGVTRFEDIFKALEKRSGAAWGAAFPGQLPC